MFQPLIVIYRNGNFVYHHWGSKSLSYHCLIPLYPCWSLCYCVYVHVSVSLNTHVKVCLCAHVCECVFGAGILRYKSINDNRWSPKPILQNYPFSRFKILELTNQNSIKYPKFFSQLIRQRGYKTLGTNVINSPMSPPSIPGLVWRIVCLCCANN